ncbi:hypothetical protein VNI00_009342 [Paramarasmius palmivorus]|uniref:F-box domain-containing protein n=1 Tax=Paramarasmius palmivorus TaxID=297713 RepID=A0AAW0CSJ5_9AGAR
MTVPSNLPTDILLLILEYFYDPAEIRRLSLVCRSWIPATRLCGFRRIQTRSWHHLLQLLLLCDSPKETLSNAHVKEVAFALSDLGYSSFKIERFVETFGRSIHTLRLNGAGIPWEQVSRDTGEAILKAFGGLATRLELVQFSFETSEAFVLLLQHFERLQSLQLVECWYRESHGPSAGIQFDIGRITDLTLVSDPKGRLNTYGLFTNCNSLKVLRIRPSRILDHSAERTAIKRILEEAGDSLEELDIEAKLPCEVHHIEDVLERHYLFTSLNLKRNTNLRKLRVAIRFRDSDYTRRQPRDYLLPILRRLVEVPRLSAGLRLEVLDLPFIFDQEMEWDVLDNLLQHPRLPCLKEVRCHTFVCFSASDCANGDYTKPSETSDRGKELAEGLRRLKSRLRRCEERGILVVDVDYGLLSIVEPNVEKEVPEVVAIESSGRGIFRRMKSAILRRWGRV